MIEDKPSLEELAHFGVKGMKWGRRRHRGVFAHKPRSRGDRSSKTTQSSGSGTKSEAGKRLGRILQGNTKYASAATAFVVGGAMYARKARVDKMVLKFGKKLYRDIFKDDLDEWQAYFDSLDSTT